MLSNHFSRLTALVALSLAAALSGCADDDGPQGFMWMSVVDDEGGGTGRCSLQFSEEDTGGGCGQGYLGSFIGMDYKIIADGIVRITVSGGATIDEPATVLVERIYEESFALNRKTEETPFLFNGHMVRLRVEGVGTGN
jgi:hypothetical protein